MDDLQELSRRAAACLPEDFFKDTECGYLSRGMLTQAHFIDIWLHESTEACTEIMVRVLFGPDFLIYAYPAVPDPIFSAKPIDASTQITKGNHEIIVWHGDCNNDPMLAYRVAVLRALTTLNAPDGR